MDYFTSEFDTETDGSQVMSDIQEKVVALAIALADLIDLFADGPPQRFRQTPR